MNASHCRRQLLTFLLWVAIAQPTFAQGDANLIKGVVEGFVNGYVQSVERALSGKHEEEADWVYKNTATTGAFKAAYRRMEDAGIANLKENPGDGGADFITLWAGDVPASPYVLTAVRVTGGRATAAAHTKDHSGPTIRLVLIKQNGTWVIDSINEVNGRRDARK